MSKHTDKIQIYIHRIHVWEAAGEGCAVDRVDLVRGWVAPFVRYEHYPWKRTGWNYNVMLDGYILVCIPSIPGEAVPCAVAEESMATYMDLYDEFCNQRVLEGLEDETINELEDGVTAWWKALVEYIVKEEWIQFRYTNGRLTRIL